MAVSIDICNRALLTLGDSTITSLSDSNPEAKLCSAFYEPSVVACLSSYIWSFALEQSILTRDVVSPVYFGLPYIYDLPVGFIRVADIRFKSSALRVKGKKVYRNVDDPMLEYVKRVDEDMFHPAFLDYLTYSLAERLAIPLLEDQSKLALYNQRAIQAKADAIMFDRMNDTPRTLGPDMSSISVLRRF